MARPTIYTPPKNEEELAKRQQLASVLKDFAAGKSTETADTLTAQGEKIGVSRGQLSNLYQRYKKEAAATPEMVGPPEPVSPPSTQSIETPRLDRLALMQGSPMGSVSIGASGVQGAVGGLGRSSSPTGGTPIGRPKETSDTIKNRLLFLAAKDRQREVEEMEARRRAFVQGSTPIANDEAFKNSPLTQMPYFSPAK